MALPQDQLLIPGVPAAFLPPDNTYRFPLTVDYELGGIALSDVNQGLQYQNWQISLNGNDVRVAPDPYVVFTTLFTEAGITELSLAFDSLMHPVVIYVASGVSKIRFFDISINNYTTLILPADTRTPFATLDDKRAFAFTWSDVLVFYISKSALFYRQQRDKYATERFLYSLPNNDFNILRVGMTEGNRVQIQMQEYTNPLCYVEEFVDGLTPYFLVQGAWDSFSIVSGPYGQEVDIASSNAAVISRIATSIPSRTYRTVRFFFTISNSQPDDGAQIELAFSGAYRFSFLPIREAFYDSLRRAYLSANGSAFTPITASQLAIGTWYVFEFEAKPAANASTYKILLASDLSVVSQGTFPGSFPPFVANQLRYSHDAGGTTCDTKFTDIYVCE